MFSILVIALGLTLTNAADRRPELTVDERNALEKQREQLTRRLTQLEPTFTRLEGEVNELIASHGEESAEVDVAQGDLDKVADELRLLLETLDELELKLAERPIERIVEDAELPAAPKRARGQARNSASHGTFRPRIGSQDPGAAEGDYRRTGVIIELGRMGKNVDGVGELKCTIRLDNPQQGEIRDLLGYEGNYEDPQPNGLPPKPSGKRMRRGDRVSFVVAQGKSSKPEKITAGRVMADKIRFHTFLSNEERQSPDWIDVFRGTIIADDGRTVLGSQAHRARSASRDRSASRGRARSDSPNSGDERQGTPHWVTERKSQAGKSRASWHSRGTGASGRTSRSQERNRLRAERLGRERSQSPVTQTRGDADNWRAPVDPTIALAELLTDAATISGSHEGGSVAQEPEHTWSAQEWHNWRSQGWSSQAWNSYPAQSTGNSSRRRGRAKGTKGGKGEGKGKGKQ